MRQYLHLVFSAVLRLVRGDEAMAKEVAQTMLIDLARKAGSLRDREMLAGRLDAICASTICGPPYSFNRGRDCRRGGKSRACK